MYDVVTQPHFSHSLPPTTTTTTTTTTTAYCYHSATTTSTIISAATSPKYSLGYKDDDIDQLKAKVGSIR